MTLLALQPRSPGGACMYTGEFPEPCSSTVQSWLFLMKRALKVQQLGLSTGGDCHNGSECGIYMCAF